MELIQLFTIPNIIDDSTPNFNTAEGFTLFLDTIAKVRNINEFTYGKKNCITAFNAILNYNNRLNICISNINAELLKQAEIIKELLKNPELSKEAELSKQAELIKQTELMKQNIISPEKHTLIVKTLFDKFPDIDINIKNSYENCGDTQYPLQKYMLETNSDEFNWQLFDLIIQKHDAIHDVIMCSIFDKIFGTIKKITSVFNTSIDCNESELFIEIIRYIGKKYPEKLTPFITQQFDRSKYIVYINKLNTIEKIITDIFTSLDI